MNPSSLCVLLGLNWNWNSVALQGRELFQCLVECTRVPLFELDAVGVIGLAEAAAVADIEPARVASEGEDAAVQ